MTKVACFILLFLFGIAPGLCAQLKADSIPVKQQQAAADTGAVMAKQDSAVFMTPKKIGLYSAILPGFGQFQNKQYWKIPVIYVGVGVAAYAFYSNKKEYDNFRREYAARVSNKGSVVEGLSNYTETQLLDAKNYYQNNLDLTYVLTGVGYALQIIDAVVFAHLKGFDMSEDISFRWKAIATPQGGPGFGLALTFK